MKKLYLSEKNKIVAGVFGGLGEYFNVDPNVFRIAYVVFAIFTGVIPGLIAYFICSLLLHKPPIVTEVKSETVHETK